MTFTNDFLYGPFILKNKWSIYLKNIFILIQNNFKNIWQLEILYLFLHHNQNLKTWKQ